MKTEILSGLLIPFLGTALGAGCVLFMKHNLSRCVQRALTGFAAGVMTAASIWSLIIPAMNMSENMGKLAFLPAVVGFWCGILFLLLLDSLILKATEEKWQHELYGREYEEYCKCVNRCIPFKRK